MNLHLEQNVDLLLIENTNLQEEVKILTKKLATQIEKYNSLSTVLQTQSDFMKEIESKVELIAKREKPLKDEVERLRRERNDAIGNDENVTPAKCQMLETEKQDITASRRRMEEENVWLVEQLHLSRRVGQDMEALVSARMDLQKTRDGEKVPTDLGERIHELHIEKTRLENDKQDLLHRVNLLSKDITSTLQVAEDWKIKCKKRQEMSVSKTLLSEKDNLRQQLNALMNQRTSDDRENEERLKYLQTQIQSLGVLQAQNSLVNNNGFTPWLQSQKQTEKENSVSGRQSLSANQAPKLTNRASFYDQNRNQAVNNQARVSVSGNRSPELTKRASFYENNDNQGINNQSRSSVSQNRYSGIHSNSKDDEAVLNAEGSKGFRQSTTSREVGNSSNAVKFSETIASQLPKKASFYQKQSLSDIDDLQEGDPNLEQRGRSSNYQQTNNSTGYQTTGETAEELRQSRSYPQPQSAMKRPANNQSHIPVSPRRQVEELSYRTVPVSPSPPNDSSKPISVFQGQSTKLIVPSPKPQPEIIENDSPTLSRPSSLKKTRIPSPTRLSRTSSFNESDNDVGKLSSSRKSVHSRTQSDLNSQPTKPKGRHILSGGEVIPIRPRTNSGSGAHLFDGPTPGGRARTKSNTSNNSVGKVPPNPFFTQTSSSHDEEIVNVLGNRTPEQALQSLESEIKALESLLFK